VSYQATKIEFRPESDVEGKLIASRVQFVVDGKVFIANASKEVILSAGAFQTPQLLELSGVLTIIIVSLHTRKIYVGPQVSGMLPAWLA
jgi:hypothetical protein